MMTQLFIPGYYLFYSRLKRKSEVLSLLYVYPLFLFLILYLAFSFEFITYSLVFLAALLTWLSFYEIGYLQNDAITIKKETNPTLRIPQEQIRFIQGNFKQIVLWKTLIGVGGLLLLWFVNNSGLMRLSVVFFLGMIVLSRISFYLHNTIRSRWNIVTYLFLTSTKYLSLPFLFFQDSVLFQVVCVSIWILFPLLRTLEHAAKVKYSITWLQKGMGNLDQFRVIYYFLCLTIAASIYLWGDYQLFWLPFLGSLWFFCYRMTVFLIVRLGAYKRTNFDSHKWK